MSDVAVLLGDAVAGEAALDGAAWELVTPAGLGRLVRVRSAYRRSRVALVGAPPTDEIGFGLACAAALLCRPEALTLLDTSTGDAAAAGARAKVLAVEQLAASAAALGAQAAVAASLRSGPPAPAPRGGTLERLLYLRPHIGTSAGVGGSITHSHEVIRALRSLGVDVDAATNDPEIAATAAADPDPPCRWRTSPTPRLLKAVPASAAFGADLALAFQNLRQARRADVIYQRNARFSLVGGLLAALARRPFFLEFNGSEVYFGAHWQRTPLLRLLALCETAALSAATRIIVVSEVGRRELVERGIAAERILVNPNAVDPARFGTGGGAAVRERLGFGPSTVAIGFIGSFGPWHGAPVLAEAFAALAAADADARLLLVGDGPEQKPTEDVLTAAGVRERATFVKRVPPADVPAYLDACDILASPHVPLPDGSPFFGSPTKLFEYMAAGKGIVASRLGQIGEVLRDGESGLLVEPGDPAALAAALARLANDPALRARLGAEARRAAEERHTWRANAERIVEAYAAAG